MSKGSAYKVKIISIILIIVGFCLALWGYQMSGSISSQFTKTITGAHTDKVMFLFIGGAASFIVGIYLNLKK